MDESIADTNQFYKMRAALHVYPVEFVVRAFLGDYPKLKMNKASYSGSRILDVGYGDGRNIPMLCNLGFDVSGIEISDEINALCEKRLRNLGYSADLKTGRNANLPFEDNFFQYVLACHSCYYIDEGKCFEDSLTEVARVLESNGRYICSVPMHDTYILQDAEKLPGGYYRITHDPYGYRKGTLFRAFKTAEEVHHTFSAHFSNVVVGFCDDDFFGVHQKVWTVVCTRQ